MSMGGADRASRGGGAPGLPRQQSHTAGACRLGLIARALIGGRPETARVELHGSFARTGTGHGTDRAIAGGLLGYQPDDVRLRESVEAAPEAGLQSAAQVDTIRAERIKDGHKIAASA